jgi:hypothetical protein
MAGDADMNRGDYLMRESIIHCCTVRSHEVLHFMLHYVTCHAITC